MPFVMVDVEADGPVPGIYSMVSLGAVIVEPGLKRRFYIEMHPVTELFVPQALAVTGFSREQTLGFAPPQEAMRTFDRWLAAEVPKRKTFIADNPGFDWGYVNYYFHRFVGKNPFGWSAWHLGSLYKGLEKSAFKSFRHLRVTEHTHNALDDALGNAEALLRMKDELGLNVRWD